VDEADVLVYDMWAAGDGRSHLIDDLRELHPDKPVVLTSGGMLMDWVEATGEHAVTPALGPPDRSVLVAAVEQALQAGTMATDQRAATAASTSQPAWPRW
jgi:DNA-binding NtrC family response regulator